LGPIVIQNSLGGQAPRWIRFDDTFVEAGLAGAISGIGVNVRAVRDFRYQGYIATSETGAAIGTGARGVDISHTEFVNIGRSAVTIAAGALDSVLDRNTFEDTGNLADGSYDTIAADPGASDFQVTYNAFRSGAKNRPRYNVSVAPGGSDRYQIVGNRCHDYVRGPVNDGGTGQSRHISENQ
jgi:hypothetical protein